MFDRVLYKAEIHSGVLVDGEPDQGKIAAVILKDLEIPVNFLLSMTKNVFSEKIFKSSKIEKTYSSDSSPVICTIRIRPENAYFLKSGKEIPPPEDPDGPDATGLEICFKVIKGFSGEDKTQFPKLYMHFTIWGEEERKAFGELLKNYYRVIELLLNEIDLEFFTAYFFARIENLKKKTTFNQLDAYYQKNDDEESTFSLGRTFTYGETYDEIIRIFLIFTALYESCLSYLYKKKDPDKILGYFQKLKRL